jgi:hypothetical protein
LSLQQIQQQHTAACQVSLSVWQGSGLCSSTLAEKQKSDKHCCAEQQQQQDQQELAKQQQQVVVSACDLVSCLSLHRLRGLLLLGFSRGAAV